MLDVTKLFFVMFMECATKVLHNLLLVTGVLFFACVVVLLCYALKCRFNK